MTPKHAGPAAAALMAIAAHSAQAQSINLYGVLDVGAAYNTNINGAKAKKLETRHEPSFWGVKGREELGEGLAAVFLLEQSLSVDTGVAGNGFSRQVFVGLSDARLGTLTVGRQNDPIYDLVGVDPPRFNSVTAVHVGNYDRTSGTYVNNAVKYRSASIDGFNASLLYSFKEDGSSAVNTGKALGGSLNYITPEMRVSAAYYKIEGVTLRPFNDIGIGTLFGISFFNQPTKTVVANQTIAGIGGYYNWAGWRGLAEYTHTKLDANNVRQTLRTAAVGFTRDPNLIGLRPAAGINHSAMNGSRWTTAYGILDYFFTRRTDVYVRLVHQRASGAEQVAALFLEGPSSTHAQTVFGAGITHRF